MKQTARENFLSLIKRSNREKTHAFVKVQVGFANFFGLNVNFIKER